MKKTGIELIAQERTEQIEKHGMTIESDVKHNNGCQLRQGAVALLDNDYFLFPKNWDDAICVKMLNKTYKERLVIAGALIAAEIDRVLASYDSD